MIFLGTLELSPSKRGRNRFPLKGDVSANHCPKLQTKDISWLIFLKRWLYILLNSSNNQQPEILKNLKASLTGAGKMVTETQICYSLLGIDLGGRVSGPVLNSYLLIFSCSAYMCDVQYFFKEAKGKIGNNGINLFTEIKSVPSWYKRQILFYLFCHLSNSFYGLSQRIYKIVCPSTGLQFILICRFSSIGLIFQGKSNDPEKDDLELHSLQNFFCLIHGKKTGQQKQTDQGCFISFSLIICIHYSRSSFN